jgi:Holliday junction DNA helicase RuvA
MIARLTGRVDTVGEDHCVIDVGGVGYLVFCGTRTLRSLPRAGEAVRLSVVTHVREDHIHLYGFMSEQEKEWFALLQTVQGVGSKVALAILSVLATGELADAIAAGDKGMVARANGVGSKLAQRICAELKDKVGGLAVGGAATAMPEGAASAAEDAISALLNLGYKPAEAYGAVMKAVREGRSETGDLIRAALKELAR